MNDPLHAELSDLLLTLERIHQFIPNDLQTLRTLTEAYMRAGDSEQAGDYLFRFAEEAATQEVPNQAVEALKLMDSPSFEKRSFDSLKDRLTPLAGNYIPNLQSATTSNQVDLYAEISLAYKLMEAQEINEQEYAGIAYDLSSLASKKSNEPITVQHALKHRTQADMDNVLAAMVMDSGMPFIQLSHFELDPNALKQLTPEYMQEKGVIIFDNMGEDAMVAVLNPYDKGLQLDIQGKLKCRCHFYLISAREFDKQLENINALENEEAV